ncbi:MAG: 1-acyl-sn-glycerol-3-phosphate acyltransferase [Clostridia bacterium]|nr:1-acyl-sn-glycerol-3-phosphate acyltransferase [Clostridia bacterium]
MKKSENVEEKGVKNTPAKSKKNKPVPVTNYFLFDFVKVTGAIPTLLFFRPKIIYAYGKKAANVKGGMLVSSNHIGFADPIILNCVFYKRRLHSLAMTELYSSPLRKWFFDRMHCIPVDRKNFTMRSLHQVNYYLAKEKAVAIFPEGQINPDRQTDVKAFKSGVILMALKNDKPILPIYIVKRKKWYNRQIVVVGKPFNVKDVCGKIPSVDQLNRASELLHESEVELMNFYNANYKNKGEI